MQILAAMIIILITGVPGRSAALALRLQTPIMVLVGLSLLVLGVGVASGDFRAPEWTASYRTVLECFWFVFAVFFSSHRFHRRHRHKRCDLKDARRSIPRGTLLAVATVLVRNAGEFAGNLM